MSDLIDRDAAIAFVDCGYLRPPTELAWSDKDVVDMLKRLPSAQPQHKSGKTLAEEVERIKRDLTGIFTEQMSTQPETHEKRTETHARDCVSGVAAIIAAIEAVDEWDGGYNVQRANMIRDAIKALPSEQPQWIPVTERLPEEDVEVLITYRYKEGEGDTSHAYIDITTYGQMYFGGNKVGDHKHWRQPFEYFTSNYEVVAWMPLPKAYKGEKE